MCLQELLAGGASVDAVDNTGHRPLHYAARKGHKEIAWVRIGRVFFVELTHCVKVLLAHKASVDVVNYNGGHHFTLQLFSEIQRSPR